MSIIPSFFGHEIYISDSSSLDEWDLFRFLPFFAAVPLPVVDWKETPDVHILKADLPGLNKNELKVEVEEEKFLKISGEASKETNGSKAIGKFLRSIKLPKDANVVDVKAFIDKGSLTVTVPKVKGAMVKPRAIEIAG